METKTKFSPPSDDQLKAAHKKAQADSGLAPTSNSVCLLATLRILRDHFGLSAEGTQAALDYFRANGHGAGCNASQWGQWTEGGAKAAKVVAKLTA